MSDLKEISIGIAKVLQHSAQPEPLPIQLWDEFPANAAKLVRHVVDECVDADVSLALVRVNKGCWQAWVFDGVSPTYRGVPLELDLGLNERLEFYRYSNNGRGGTEGQDKL